jgi:hypothetical protein
MAGAMTGARCTLAMLAAVVVALGDAGRAEPPAPAPPAETKPLPERARAVLEAHCAECKAAHADGAALDLDALAGDLRLVIPHRPDASRIYQHLLRAPDEKSAPSPAPTPAEVETVRDWIESLPARAEACRRVRLETNADVASRIAASDRKLTAAGRADTRYISLVHLKNACAAPQRLQQYRNAVEALLRSLARSRETLALGTLGAEGDVLVVRLGDLGLAPADWIRLTVSAPRLASADAIPADWLAARILAKPKDEAGNVDPVFDVQFDAANQRAVERLAASWNGDVDLIRAAAERGVPPRELAQVLSRIGGEFLQPARRLMYGTLTRHAWDSLHLALDGEASPGSADRGAPEVSETEIEVVLWTDRPVYRPRDLMTISVSVSKACHLTLIDVDRDGKAIVLFPNELDQDNLIAPSVNIQIPGRDAGYQFRLDRSGEEQIVAICQRKSRRPDGISYDYEKQRFALLGDWCTFLRTASERGNAIRNGDDGETSRRRRRSRPSAGNGLPVIGADDPVDIEGRAAITVTIDPGGGAR